MSYCCSVLTASGGMRLVLLVKTAITGCLICSVRIGPLNLMRQAARLRSTTGKASKYDVLSSISIPTACPIGNSKTDTPILVDDMHVKTGFRSNNCLKRERFLFHNKLRFPIHQTAPLLRFLRFSLMFFYVQSPSLSQAGFPIPL